MNSSNAETASRASASSARSPASEELAPGQMAMGDQLDGLARELRELSQTGRGRVIVGIVGAPGTGKSTLSARLQKLVGDDTCVVVPMDGFHLSQEILHGTDLASRRGATDTFDVGGYISLLQRLHLNSEDVVYAPTYNRKIEDPVAASIAVAQSVPVVLTEGNYLLSDADRWGEVHQYLDEVWYIETPHDVRISRLIDRHVAFGKPPEAAVEWATGSDQANAGVVEATRSRADRVIIWN